VRKLVLSGLIALAALLAAWAAWPAAGAAKAASMAAIVPSGGGVAGPAASFLARHADGARVALRPDATAATTAAFNQVFDASCIQPGLCLAVGGNVTADAGWGTPFAAKWTGTGTWGTSGVHLPSGASGGLLTSTSCTATGCVTVGYYRRGSTTYALSNVRTTGGWQLGPQPQPVSGASTVILESVSCVTEQHCVAAGYYSPASNPNVQEAIAEVWNGSVWRLSVMPPRSFSNLDTVSCPTTAYCLLGGYYFSAQGGVVLAERFDGAHWGAVTVAAPSPASGYVDDISGVSCSSTTSCVAVGLIGKIVSSTSVSSTGFTEVLSGGAWHIEKVSWPGGGAQSALFAVSCVSPAFCVAAGGVGPFATTMTDGRLAYAVWTGSAWHLHVPTQAAGQGSVLDAVQCDSATYCVAGGTQGPFNGNSGHGITEFYNGATWTLVSLP
jgi:hypothetical protein